MVWSALQYLRKVVTICVIYLGAGYLSRAIAGSGEAVPVWLPTGIIFGILLILPSRNWSDVILGSIIGSAIWASFSYDLPVGPSLVIALIEIGCILPGVWIAGIERKEMSSDMARFFLFLSGGVLSAVLGATLACELWRWQRPLEPYSIEWRNWALSTALGILLVAPFIREFSQFQVRRSGGLNMNRFAGGALAFLLFAAIANVMFSSDVAKRFGTVAPTLTYLPMPFLVIAGILWGSRGGVIAALLGALFIIVKTESGGGPFAIAEEFSGEAVIEAQTYIAVWSILLMLIFAVIEDRRRALQAAKNWQLRYERVLSAAGAATVEVDAKTGRIVWGDDATALFGANVALVGNIADWLARVDENARGVAKAGWDTASNGRSDAGATYEVDLGGRKLPITVSWSPVRGPDGSIELVAGLILIPTEFTPDAANA